MKYPDIILLSGLLIIPFFVAGQDDAEKKTHHLDVAAGLLSMAQRDPAYSPLSYGGILPSVTIGYGNEGAKKSERFWLNFSAGHLENDFNARMRSTTAGFLNYTFYFRDSDASQDLVFGWANHNLLNIRHFEDAANFSPRFDYHTSFGPAASFRRIFGGPRFRLDAEAAAHFQLIGFMLQSAYVAGGPGGDGDGLRSLLDSATLFYPGKAWDWGMSLRLRYTLSSGNSVSFQYRYDRTTLEKSHRSARSGGHYFLMLTAML